MYKNNFSIIPDFLSNEIFSERFNHIDNLFSRLTGNFPINNFPNYDIKKIDNNKFEISISVPGYKKEDLDVYIKNNFLFIKGKKQKLENNNDFLYKGIINKNFSLNFNINKETLIENIILKNGLLKIDIKQKLSDLEKIKKLNIQE